MHRTITKYKKKHNKRRQRPWIQVNEKTHKMNISMYEKTNRIKKSLHLDGFMVRKTLKIKILSIYLLSKLKYEVQVL